MQEITIWHNPKCLKSREAIAILNASGCESKIVKYLETSQNTQEIKKVMKMLGINARELMRTKEELYKELKLGEEQNEERLIEAMVQNPKLIERPLIIKGNKAIIGRPPSLIVDFLK
ncbi:MAG TPA: arsenate reductase (glutaredoxin) [Sulfurimonas sp. UBA12504]|nr:MAG: arsenate reductase (glutaredoxin) [Sulfurimonas sp. GWF2_37_8]DAB29725.1 MAG TPA: arsenate reductase (glutaredoxin) [Sulfurimonas sp. UBA12504]